MSDLDLRWPEVVRGWRAMDEPVLSNSGTITLTVAPTPDNASVTLPIVVGDTVRLHGGRLFRLGSMERLSGNKMFIVLREAIPAEPKPPPEEPAEERRVEERRGIKFDKDKQRWDLLPTIAVAEVVGVLTYGARKYAPDNWRHVAGWKWRYYGAAMRHLVAWWLGEMIDPESGKHHLAHAVCCLLFATELDLSEIAPDPMFGFEDKVK